MTTKEAAILAKRAWREQAEHRRQEFCRWLVRRSQLSDFPEETDRVAWHCARGRKR